MIRYFRINDPLRIFGVLIVLLALRLPMLFGDFSLTFPELRWLLAGQALQNGQALYTDVWENIGPISAWVYYVFGLLWPQNPLPLRLAAILLLIVQAFYFNSIMVRHNVYKENTFVPGLCYMLFAHLTFDFNTLSPPLIALSFLLPVLENLVRMGERQREDRIVVTGTYIGLAVLCYLPSASFLLMTLLTYALYKSSSGKRLLLLIFSFSLVQAVHFTYLLFFSSPRLYVEMYLLSPFTVGPEWLLSLAEIGWVALLPAVLFVWSILRVLAERGFVNYQSTIQRIMLLWIIFAAIGMASITETAPYHFLLFLPATSFFVAHYLLLIRRRIWAELTLWFFIFSLATISYGSYHWRGYIEKWVDFSTLLAKLPPNSFQQNKGLLVLGEQPTYYLGNHPATPYLDWQISQRHFGSLDHPWAVSEIYLHLSAQWPELIYDDAGLMPQLIHRIPEIAKNYRPVAGQKGWYERIGIM